MVSYLKKKKKKSYREELAVHHYEKVITMAQCACLLKLNNRLIIM